MKKSNVSVTELADFESSTRHRLSLSSSRPPCAKDRATMTLQFVFLCAFFLFVSHVMCSLPSLMSHVSSEKK